MIISVSNARPSCHLQNDNSSRLAEWKGWLAGAWSDASVHKIHKTTGQGFYVSQKMHKLMAKNDHLHVELLAMLLMLLSMDAAEKQKRAHQLIITRQQPCLNGSLICGRWRIVNVNVKHMTNVTNQ